MTGSCGAMLEIGQPSVPEGHRCRPPPAPVEPAGPRPPGKLLPAKPVGNDPAKPPWPPTPLITPCVTPPPTQRGEIIGGEQNKDPLKPVQESEAQSLLVMHFAPSGSVPGVVQKPASQTPGLAHRSVHASPSMGRLPHSPMPSLCLGWHARSARQGGMAGPPHASPSLPGGLQTAPNWVSQNSASAGSGSHTCGWSRSHGSSTVA